MSVMTLSSLQGERRRWAALGAVLLAQLMIVLDATIVNVALPAIQTDLHFSQSSLTWVVNAYLITFGSFLLVAGRLGDLVGRRRVLLDRPRRLHRRLGPVRPRPGRHHARRRALRAGPRRRPFLGGHPRDPRHRVPRRRGAHAGDEPLHLRVGGGRVGRPAGRRRLDPGHRLALDLLRQRPDRHRHRAGRCARSSRRAPASVSARASTCSARSSSPPPWRCGVYAIVEAPHYGWASLHTLGFGSVAAVAARCVPRARGAPARTRSCRCACCGMRTLAGSSVVRAMMGMGMYGSFFLGALYLERVQGYGSRRHG